MNEKGPFFTCNKDVYLIMSIQWCTMVRLDKRFGENCHTFFYKENYIIKHCLDRYLKYLIYFSI